MAMSHAYEHAEPYPMIEKCFLLAVTQPRL
ncbi:hypothetical protein SSPIM334S_07661 [Streptomyces spiroverticillatus]